MMILLILLHLLAGLGLLSRLGGARSRAELLGLSFLVGLGLHTLTVFLLGLAHVPLRSLPVMLALTAVTALTWLRNPAAVQAVRDFFKKPWDIRLYEFPFFLLGGGIVLLSMWNAYYQAVSPYDAMVGMDLFAKSAAREGKLISAAFTHPNLQFSIQNQLYYAPFTSLSQLIWKLGGHTVGQTWLGLVAGAFTLFTYGWFRQRVHPVLAGVLALLLLLTPEMYIYTYLFLTDYSAAVFFGAGMLMLYEGLREGREGRIWLSAILLALSVWSRADSLLLLLPVPFLLWMGLRGGGMGQAFRQTALYSAVLLLPYLLWNVLFYALLPRVPQGLLRPEAGDMGHLMQVFSLTASHLLFNINLYMPYLLLAALVFLLSLVLHRRMQGGFFLLTGLWVILGLVLVGHLFTAASVDNTLKRGMFRLFPLLFAACAVSPLLQGLTARLRTWEGRPEGEA